MEKAIFKVLFILIYFIKYCILHYFTLTLTDIVSGNQHVTFAFLRSLGIYQQSNKGYKTLFYLLQFNMTKHFSDSDLSTNKQVDNIRATEGR